MGRQINFFLHPDDQESIDSLLKSCGEVILLPYFHSSNEVLTVKDTIVHNVKKEGDRIYLIRPENFTDIKLVHFKKYNYWLIDDKASPVLHFDRSIFRDNTIHRGRIYFEPHFLEDMEWIIKPEEFINWADKIIRTIRRKLKKYKHQMGKYNYTDYLGANALLWMEHTKAKMNECGNQLIPTIDQAKV